MYICTAFSFNLAFAHLVGVICTEMPERRFLSRNPDKPEGFLVENLDLTYRSLELKEISCHCEQCFDIVHSTLFGSDCMWGESLVLSEAHDGPKNLMSFPTSIRTNRFFLWLSSHGAGWGQGSLSVAFYPLLNLCLLVNLVSAEVSRLWAGPCDYHLFLFLRQGVCFVLPLKKTGSGGQ